MRKKEILIIILIIGVTLLVAFSSTIIDFFKNNNETVETEEKEEKYITISFKGELIEEVSFKVRKGVTFAYLYQFLENYLNSYSVIDIDFNQSYSESTEIIISTSDITEEETEDLTNKICINTALQKELILLYGIGDKRALRIIEYRNNKLIEDWDELKKLIEVSDYVIEQIKKEAYL